MELMPRWRNLNHFNHVMEVHFADGSKYEDISKVCHITITSQRLVVFMLPLIPQLIIFAAHNIFTEDDVQSGGYALLRCIRSYLEHDMYLAFELHTEDTLAAGREILPRFLKLLKVILN